MLRNRHGALPKGRLVCKGCDRAMTHSFTCNGERRYRYDTCTRAIKNGRKACPSGSLTASEIERVVVDQIRGIAADPGLRAEVLRQAQERFEGELAEQYGPRACVRRYDTIIVSSLTPLDFHRRNVESLCRDLAGATDEVVISFVRLYQ